MSTIAFRILGDPKGQPRGRAGTVGGHARVYHPKNGPDAGWRSAVYTTALEHRPETPITEPIRVELLFWFRRPKGHYGTGKNSGNLKKTAPWWHGKKPDTDNLAKLVLDVLTSLGYWRDDCQVDALMVAKAYAPDAGCRVCIKPLRNELSLFRGFLS